VTDASAMAAVPIKPEYGPTLGRILSPRWRAASTFTRAVVILACAGTVALVLGAVLTLENATYSHAGKVPFSFSYRSLYRVRPDPGEYIKLERHYPDGTLEDSLAVAPLALAPYTGEASAALSLYAAGYIRALAARYQEFSVRGDGKTKINVLPGYHVIYSARVDGHTMWGRDVLVLPNRPHARNGVVITMLTSPTANVLVSAPLEVATIGVLQRPLKTFSFG
jgi:hypothetical protein